MKLKADQVGTRRLKSEETDGTEDNGAEDGSAGAETGSSVGGLLGWARGRRSGGAGDGWAGVGRETSGTVGGSDWRGRDAGVGGDWCDDRGSGRVDWDWCNDGDRRVGADGRGDDSRGDDGRAAVGNWGALDWERGGALNWGNGRGSVAGDWCDGGGSDGRGLNWCDARVGAQGRGGLGSSSAGLLNRVGASRGLDLSVADLGDNTRLTESKGGERADDDGGTHFDGGCLGGFGFGSGLSIKEL